MSGFAIINLAIIRHQESFPKIALPPLISLYMTWIHHATGIQDACSIVNHCRAWVERTPGPTSPFNFHLKRLRQLSYLSAILCELADFYITQWSLDYGYHAKPKKIVWLWCLNVEVGVRWCSYIEGGSQLKKWGSNLPVPQQFERWSELIRPAACNSLARLYTHIIFDTGVTVSNPWGFSKS